MEMAVAFLFHLEAELFFQQAAAFAQFDDIVVETVEPLRQPAGLQPQRRIEIVGVFLFEPVKQYTQAGQLPMQPHAGSPLPAELTAHVRLDLPGEHLLLDIIDIGADLDDIEEQVSATSSMIFSRSAA